MKFEAEKMDDQGVVNLLIAVIERAIKDLQDGAGYITAKRDVASAEYFLINDPFGIFGGLSPDEITTNILNRREFI